MSTELPKDFPFFRIGEIVQHKESKRVSEVCRFENPGTDIWTCEAGTRSHGTGTNLTGPYKQMDFVRLVPAPVDAPKPEPTVEPKKEMRRADFLPVPQKFNLAMACNLIGQCFGRNYGVYHVGSSLERRDYRDVDIRVILDDAEFDRLFPCLVPLDSCQHKTVHEPKGYVCSACKPTFTVQVPTPQLDATWSLLCAAISLWLQRHSDLPVDFQIQRQTQANEEFKGRRNGIGLYYAEPKKEQG